VWAAVSGVEVQWAAALALVEAWAKACGTDKVNESQSVLRSPSKLLSPSV
jgi:hypothetical protein